MNNCNNILGVKNNGEDSMNIQFDVNNVSHAIETIQNPTSNSKQIEESNKFLLAFLESPKLFEICNMILKMKKDFQSCFMASNLLNEKLKKGWEKLENKVEIRMMIFSNAYDLIGLHNVLDNKLSVLTSTVVINSLDQWETSIAELIDMAKTENYFIQKSVRKPIRLFILNILEKIPTNVGSTSKSKLIKQKLSLNLPNLLNHLNLFLKSVNIQNYNQIVISSLKVLRTWAELGKNKLKIKWKKLK